jgi:hypothetical protein
LPNGPHGTPTGFDCELFAKKRNRKFGKKIRTNRLSSGAETHKKTHFLNNKLT